MTLVSHRARFIFLKTHKTASTSVEVALEPLCAPEGTATGRESRAALVSEAGVIGARGRIAEGEVWRNHMSARSVKRLVGPRIWRDYAKISIVRNPYDRFVSMFHSRLAADRRAALAGAPFDDVAAAFRDWLPTEGRANMLSKLTLGGFVCLDRVLHYERLEADFAALAADLGLPPAPLPRFKTDRRLRAEPFAAYYDDRSAAVVRRLAGFELAYFGYDLAGGPHPRTPLGRAAALARLAPARLPALLRPPPQGMS